MKTLLAATALAAIVLAGAPVNAQTMDNGLSAFAQTRTRTVVQRRNGAVNHLTNPDGRMHSDNPAYDVYDTNGNYIGSDPDAQIRNELMRDPPGRGD